MKSKTIVMILALLSGMGFLNAEENSKGAGKQDLDIYLCIGQSNMAGRAPYSKADEAVIPRCYLLNAEDKWEPAKNPLNRYSTIRKGLNMQKMGPGYMFAQTMLEKYPQKTIGLVVNAKGGTSIRQWKKGGEFYNEAVRRTKIAMQNGTLKGILWHQGETDRNDAKWLEKLKVLIADLRAEFKMPDLPVIAGQVNDVELINQQVIKLPDEVKVTGVVSSEGLKAMDRWHFDEKSMKLLGIRYAEKMIEVQGNNKTIK